MRLAPWDTLFLQAVYFLPRHKINLNRIFKTKIRCASNDGCNVRGFYEFYLETRWPTVVVRPFIRWCCSLTDWCSIGDNHNGAATMQWRPREQLRWDGETLSMPSVICFHSQRFGRGCTLFNLRWLLGDSNANNWRFFRLFRGFMRMGSKIWHLVYIVLEFVKIGRSMMWEMFSVVPFCVNWVVICRTFPRDDQPKRRGLSDDETTFDVFMLSLHGPITRLYI